MYNSIRNTKIKGKIMKVKLKDVHKDIKVDFMIMSIFPKIYKNDILRNMYDKFSRKINVGSNIKSLECSEVKIKNRDNSYNIRVRIYKPKGMTEKLPILFYFHGGGYLIGCPEYGNVYFEKYINKRPCIIIAPDYTKAEIKPYPAAFNDSIDTMRWAKDNAETLGGLKEKFILVGYSAGGG